MMMIRIRIRTKENSISKYREKKEVEDEQLK